MDSSRAWAEVDLDALSSNLQAIRRRIGTDVRILLVAKADAYGHGAVAVSHHALRSGADAIGVTTCAEALELRQAGIRSRIVVLGPVFAEESPPAIRSGIELSVPSIELCQQVERAAVGLPRAARIHAKIDTGMGRLGVAPERALSLLETVRRSPHLELCGVMTHLAATDGTLSAATHEQLRLFEGVLAGARQRDLLERSGLWIHAANSAAVLSGMAPLYDAVRVGIAAYGIPPDPRVRDAELTPVLSVRTRIVHLRELRPGDRVGYGGTWSAPNRARIAVLPVGYDDGVSWRLGNRGWVLIRGRRAPVVGRISMDYTTVDVSGHPEVQLGDVATLLGADGEEAIRVEELAAIIGTIPYEILCSVGKRVRRTYVGGVLPAETPPEPVRG